MGIGYCNHSVVVGNLMWLYIEVQLCVGLTLCNVEFSGVGM